MTGNNEFRFNRATMHQIVQYYLANVLFKAGQAPIVTYVREQAGDATFIVRTKEPGEAK
jgi:hypothetical protein